MAEELKKSEELIKTTKSDVFKPTASMVVWLNAAIQSETDSISEIAEHCEPKIDRTNWYRWLEIPGFIDWFNKAWNERLKGHAWKLDTIGLKNSKRDFNYWKSMQQRVGNLQDKPSSLQQFNVNGEMKLEFTGDENT